MENKQHQEHTFEKFSAKWRSELEQHLPEYKEQIDRFIEDEEFGLKHSYAVWLRASELADKVEAHEGKPLNREAIELLAVFHDIGKFLQSQHSLENISLAEGVFQEYASHKQLDQNVRDDVGDGIRNSDFYNSRIEPKGKLPRTLEGEIVRAADKMLENIVRKVDRYWYQYGVPRGMTFFDPNLTPEDRSHFSFQNFSGDQLNVILTIIALRPEDFSHLVIQQEYATWSRVAKEMVIERILSLAKEIGETPENIQKIIETIVWYRQAFRC